MHADVKLAGLDSQGQGCRMKQTDWADFVAADAAAVAAAESVVVGGGCASQLLP